MKCSGLWPWALTVSCLACGGASGQGSNEGAKSGGDDKPAPKPSDDGTLAEQREHFMSTCAKRLPGAPDYCQCSWDLLREVFSEADMKAKEPDPAKMQAYKVKLPAACGGKIPEPIAREKFMEGCTNRGDQLKPYCECGWSELRKSLSVGDLALSDETTSERLIAATKDMLKTCSAKLPEKVVKDAFVLVCSNQDPAAKAFCECAWKQLRESASAAEIHAGIVDMAAAKPKIKAACGKLHPDQQSAAKP